MSPKFGARTRAGSSRSLCEGSTALSAVGHSLGLAPMAVLWVRSPTRLFAAAATAGRRVVRLPRSFSSLTRDDVRRLASRGRPIGLGAKELMDRIPRGVKDVAAYLKNRDLSHIKSRTLHPEQAGDLKNLLFERSSWNRSRGIRNMKRWEVARIHLDNGWEVLRSNKTLAVTVAVAASIAVAGSTVYVLSRRIRAARAKLRAGEALVLVDASSRPTWTRSQMPRRYRPSTNRPVLPRSRHAPGIRTGRVQCRRQNQRPRMPGSPRLR